GIALRRVDIQLDAQPTPSRVVRDRSKSWSAWRHRRQTIQKELNGLKAYRSNVVAADSEAMTLAWRYLPFAARIV
ncbi:hypothetical protein E4U21_005247, partial [Claviceps maximensis]